MPDSLKGGTHFLIPDPNFRMGALPPPLLHAKEGAAPLPLPAHETVF